MDRTTRVVVTQRERLAAFKVAVEIEGNLGNCCFKRGDRSKGLARCIKAVGPGLACVSGFPT